MSGETGLLQYGMRPQNNSKFFFVFSFYIFNLRYFDAQFLAEKLAYSLAEYVPKLALMAFWSDEIGQQREKVASPGLTKSFIMPL